MEERKTIQSRTYRETLQTRMTLLQKIQDKFDKSSWDEFLEFYECYIYNILRSLGIQQELSHELLQQVRIKLWEKLPSLDATTFRGKFRSWLYSVVLNHARDHFRKDKTYREKLSQFDELIQQHKGVELDQLEIRAEREWREYLFSQVWKMVEKKYSTEACQCFKRLSNGDSPKHVSEELKMNVNTVYTHKRRILEFIHQEIRKLDIEKG